MPSFSASRRNLLLTGAALPLIGCAAMPRQGLPQKQLRVSAPFDMPSITVPDFSSTPRFPITQFGATRGDQAKTSTGIANAISAANAAGGGVVVVPPGEWPTGKVHLKSNVNLHLEEGATLLFSEKPEDYLPAVPSTWEGIECYNYSPLVYAYDCENIALSGEGKLVAKMDVWRVWFARPKAHMDALVALYNMACREQVPLAQRVMTNGTANLRPQFILFNRCRNVLIEGVSIENSPFWVIHPFLCRDVVIRRVKIYATGHNNDGVDPEMSQNVLIEDCVLETGDDVVSVKSGRDRDAWRLNTPSRNIVMRNCHARNGHQMMAIGSELSGGVENVLVDNCHFKLGDSTINSKFNNLLYVKTNERRGGFVRNIHMSNVTASTIAGGVLAVETDVMYQWKTLVPTYERRLTPIEGLYVSNVRVEEAAYLCHIKAERQMPVRRIQLADIKIDRIDGKPIETLNVEDFVNKA